MAVVVTDPQVVQLTGRTTHVPEHSLIREVSQVRHVDVTLNLDALVESYFTWCVFEALGLIHSEASQFCARGILHRVDGLGENDSSGLRLVLDVCGAGLACVATIEPADAVFRHFAGLLCEFSAVRQAIG